MRLPTELAERMRLLLGDEEYESFRAAMEEDEPVRGVRLCRKAGSDIEKQLKGLMHIERMPYGKNGY